MTVVGKLGLKIHSIPIEKDMNKPVDKASMSVFVIQERRHTGERNKSVG